MRSEGVGAARALAEWHDDAKTCGRERVHWQSGSRRRGPAAVAAPGAARRRDRTGSGAR